VRTRRTVRPEREKKQKTAIEAIVRKQQRTVTWRVQPRSSFLFPDKYRRRRPDWQRGDGMHRCCARDESASVGTTVLQPATTGERRDVGRMKERAMLLTRRDRLPASKADDAVIQLRCRLRALRCSASMARRRPLHDRSVPGCPVRRSCRWLRDRQRGSTSADTKKEVFTAPLPVNRGEQR
jgi:hypothetical protein